mgnify:CR=1 FL=1
MKKSEPKTKSSSKSNSATHSKSDKIDFEKKFLDLEKITEKLDSSNLSLEDSLGLYEKGINIAKQCEKHLNEAEQKVEILTNSINENFKTEDFDVEENTNE